MYGYNLNDDYDPLCLSGFADDVAVTADTETSAIRTIDLLEILFLKIGLTVNPAKSKVINIRNGILTEQPIILSNGNEIESLRELST